MIDQSQVYKELKRVQRLAEPFAKQVAPIYAMFDWWWYRLGRPPEAEEIYDQIIYFLSIIEINESTQDFKMESGGIEIEVKRVNEKIEIDIILKITANLIDAIQEL